MIDIVKKGVLLRYKFECYHCGCIFKCDELDLSLVYQRSCNGDASRYVIKCPTCEKPIQIRPEYLKDYAVNENTI